VGEPIEGAGNGEVGPQGPQGELGEAGPQGPQGEPGEADPEQKLAKYFFIRRSSKNAKIPVGGRCRRGRSGNLRAQTRPAAHLWGRL
jgi:hypothetical protein